MGREDRRLANGSQVMTLARSTAPALSVASRLDPPGLPRPWIATKLCGVSDQRAQPAQHAFDGIGAVYDAVRPGYPPAAMRAIVADVQWGDQPLAVDLGCGTGISSRALADAGAPAVLGIDPNPDMLDVARRRVRVHRQPMCFCRGSATEPGFGCGLGDATADLVLAAQSFHWFDSETSRRMIHRVLRPEGRFAAVWNVRQGGDPCSDAWISLVDRARGAARHAGHPSPPDRDTDLNAGGRFVEVDRHEFDHPHRLDRTAAISRMQSASYCARCPPGEAAAILQGVARLVDEYADSAGTICIAQRTQVIVSRRSPDP